MCHSVEMYMPQATRTGVEERLAQADFAGAAREPGAISAGPGPVAALVRFVRGLWRPELKPSESFE